MFTAMFRYITFSLLLGVAVAFADTPNVGDKAPLFTLSYATADTIVSSGFTLANAIGDKFVVLAFYPANWSGGCTAEMCTMRDSFADLAELDAAVYGISGDYVYAHRAWAKELGLQFALLSDHKHEVAALYGSYNEHTGYNKRTVFVIDKTGTIVYRDLEYSARTLESFNELKAALSSFKL